jgi:hypothetical protein
MRRLILFATFLNILLGKPPTFTEWMGVYIQNHKIGYTYLEIQPWGEGYLVIERTSMSLNMLGQEKSLTTFIRAVSNSDLSLREFRFELLTGDQRLSASGKVENNNLFIKFRTAEGTESERSLFSEGKIYLTPLLEAALIMDKLPEREIKIFDPSTFSLEDAEISFLGKETVNHRGRLVEAKVYVTEFMGISSRTWVADGKIIKEESAMNIVSFEEPEEEATKIGEERIDLLYLFAVTPDGEVGNVGELVSLKIRIEGVSTSILDLNFANQHLIKKGDDWAVLKYDVEGGDGPRNIQNYLKPTSFLQINSPEIRRLAEKITAGIEDQETKAKKILRWVYENLEKKPTVTLPTALDVIKMGYGDCNEHSVLYAALARAAGIPTEIVVGLVYQEGAYYYHAWDAVYLNGKWLFVDPVFGEFPASLGHLMLKRGEIERQAELLPVVGNLKIKILERKYRRN